MFGLKKDGTIDKKLRGQLLQALGHFQEPELKRISFFVLGSGGYDNLRGPSFPEKAISLLEHLEFRGRVIELVEYIKEVRPDIELQYVAPEEPLAEIEFMNRVNEVQYITNPYSPTYMLVSAPLGYGKTRLLEIVKSQFQSQGRFCVHCTLEKNHILSIEDLVGVILQELGVDTTQIGKHVTSFKEYGFLLAKEFVAHMGKLQAHGALLLLDQVETLENQVASQFLNKVLPGLNRGLRSAGYHDQLKVILSGCYVSEWEQLSNLPLSLLPVTPFNFPVVQQTVQRFMSNAQASLPIESAQEIAAHIMYLTGGHPGCMIQLLKDFPVGWPAQEYFIGQQDQHYEQVIDPVINNVRQHIPRHLHNIFDRLCVVRRFNSRFLRHLMDANLITWPRSEYELEDELTRTHMVTRTHGFLHDAITQRLLSNHFRRSDPDRFLAICEQAIVFYEKDLQDIGSNRPDILAIELLFQKLQLVHYKQLGGKKEILDTVPGIMKQLMDGRDNREMVRSCVDLLKNDWEFRFTFNYLLQDGIYSNETPYNELIENVRTFLSEEDQT